MADWILPLGVTFIVLFIIFTNARRDRERQRREDTYLPEDGKHVFMLERLWLGLSRWFWVETAFLVVVLVAFLAVWRVQENGDQDRERERARLTEQRARDLQASIDQDYNGCLRGNETREIMKAIVNEAYQSGGSFDATRVPGFENLSEAEQAFWRNIAAASSGGSSNTEERKQALLKILVLRDCESEFPDHTGPPATSTTLGTTSTTEASG